MSPELRDHPRAPSIDRTPATARREAVDAFDRSQPRLESQADGLLRSLTWRPLFKLEP